MTTQRTDDLPERWSAPRKMEIVLRLVRGGARDPGAGARGRGMAPRVPGGRAARAQTPRARSRGTRAAAGGGPDRRQGDAPRAGETPARKKGVRGGRAEAAEMSRRRSPIVGKRYPLRTARDVGQGARSAVYALTVAPAPALAATK